VARPRLTLPEVRKATFRSAADRKVAFLTFRLPDPAHERVRRQDGSMGDDGTPERRDVPAVGDPAPHGNDRHPAGLDHPLPPPDRSGRVRPLRLHVAGAVLLALAAVAAVATAFVGAGPALADRVVLGDAIGLRSDPLTWFAVIVTNAGSTVAMGGLAALVALWLLRSSRTPEAVYAIAVAAGAALAFNGLKQLLDRPRPPVVDQLVGVGNASLPSGHATMSAAVIGSMVVLAWSGRRTAARVAILAAALVWVVSVGLTRIYLGVHWFSDVIAGWLVGGAWLAVCTVVLVAVRRRVPAR
jgi:membrane-associated phospholipid phosphatase